MKICHLFRLRIETISFDDLAQQNGVNIRDKMISLLKIDTCSNSFFFLQTKYLLELDYIKNDELCDRFNDESFILIANMDDLEYSNLSLNILSLTEELIIEKEEALKCLNSFSIKLNKDKRLEGILAAGSRDDKALRGYLLKYKKRMEKTKAIIPSTYVRIDTNSCLSSRGTYVQQHSKDLFHFIRIVSLHYSNIQYLFLTAKTSIKLCMLLIPT